MHIEYAAEIYKGMKQPKHVAPLADRLIVSSQAGTPEFLALAEKLDGDTLARDIVATIRKSAGNRFAKITLPQKTALAAALLAKHGTAAAVYAAALGVTEAEFSAVVQTV